MRARAFFLLAAFLFSVIHPLLFMGQNQNPPSSGPQLGSAEYPLCLFPATKAEHDPAGMALLNRVITTGLVRLPNSSGILLKGKADKLNGEGIVAWWPFYAIEARGHVKIVRRKSIRHHKAPISQASSTTSASPSGVAGANSFLSITKKQSAHFGRSVGDLLPILSVDPSSTETSSVTMVSTSGSLATIRIASVDRSFSLFAQKKAGPIVDLTVNTENATLVRAMVRSSGCEGTEVLVRRLEFKDYTTINGHMMPSRITVMQGDNKFVYHIQTVRMEQ